MSAGEAQDTTNAAAEEPLSFDSMPLTDDVRRSLQDMGYEQPTPVQAAVFEVASSGRDCIVQARTGTGKTCAFGLPLVDKLVNKAGAAQALVLCPTRELALQVSREIDKLGKHRGIVTVPIYGGAAMGRQIDQIESGAQIVVGTPGRTLDHLRRRNLDARTIKTLVLDESDEMLSMGFERELTAIIEHLPDDRQTLLFSATLPPDTERLAKNKLQEPEILILSGDHIGALEILHFVYMVSTDKVAAMKQVLEIEDPESAIIFCNTKDMTQRVATALRREGYESDWLNGDMPQGERETVMKRTREGKCRFLVATDVAARGIDISHLTHVINFDFPQDAEAYVHRTGRTGRAGNTGTALSLIAPKDIGGLYMLRLTYKIRPVERQLPSAQEQRTRAEADIVGSLASTFAPRGTAAEHRALARRLLTHDDAETIIAGILREHLNTNPELPELAQSRRRGKTPPPVPEEEPKREKTRRKRRSSRDDERRDDKRSNGKRAEGDEAPKRARRTRATKKDEPTPDTVAAEAEAVAEAAPAAEEAPPKEKRTRRRAKRTKVDGDEVAADTKASKADSSAKAASSAKADMKASKADSSSNEEDSSAKKERPAKAKPRASRSTKSTTKRDAAPTPRVTEVTDEADAAPVTQEAGKSRSKARSPRKKAATRRSSSDEAAVRAPKPPASDPGPTGTGRVELHVDAGRKDGARVQVLKTLLVDGGVSLDSVHRVRVRERYAFVEVDVSSRDAALEALGGAKIGERTVTATLSERSG